MKQQSLDYQKIQMLTFFGALLAIIFATLVGYGIGGWILTVILDVAILVVVFALRKMFLPVQDEVQNPRVIALITFAAIAGSIVSFWDPIILSVITWIFSNLGISALAGPTVYEQIIVLAIVGVVFVLLMGIYEKNQILPAPHPVLTSDQDAFPKTDYKELRDRFCNYMITVLNKMDEELNWSDSDFTTLEADLTMEQRGSSRSQIAPDLIEAIKKDHTSRTFILIGDPGSGKSVSMRRLARQLYEDVSKTGIVPIYINLREWDSSRELNDSEIVDFIYAYMLRISGRAGQAFLKNWYEKMLSHGLFFFLLDSFDEMPAVLDCDDHSSELRKISDAFDRFFNDIHQCRGILSSRPFRQPVGVRGRRLTIRPFTEEKILKAMKNWLRGWSLDANKIIRNLMANRPELAPAIRNPFMADLMAQYVIDHPTQLPATYYELFDHYITKRLKEDITNLQDLHLKLEDIVEGATKIAWAMYNTPEVGLEMDVSRLQNLIPNERIADKISAMRFSRLARVGGSNGERFSFVHRRFAEFFAVRALQVGDTPIQLDSIPSDSRWRDALVVFSGIAPLEKVTELAIYSWGVIQNHADDLRQGNIQQAIPAIHCLRFLRDACQSRPESIVSFQEQLSELILELIKSDDLLTAKISSEVLPLLTSYARSTAISTIFRRNIAWLSETALRACRHLPSLEANALTGIRQFIRTIPTYSLLRNFRDIDFSLSLSESLKFIRLGLWLDVVSLGPVVLLNLGLLFVQDGLRNFMLSISGILLYEILLFYVFFTTSKRSTLIQTYMRSGFDTSLRLISIITSFSVLWGFTNFQKNTNDIIELSHQQIILVFLFVSAIPWEFWLAIWKLVVNINKLPQWYAANYKKLITYIAVIFLMVLGSVILIVIISFVIKYSILVEIGKWIFLFLGVVGVISIIFISIKFIQNYWKDFQQLKYLALDNETTWITVCQLANSFRTEWGQTRFFAFIHGQRIKVHGYQDNMSRVNIRGKRANAQFARLREYILGLQE